MAKVGIVMGSDSDMPVMSKAAAMLEKLGVDYEMTIISAHREPDVFFEYAKSAEEKGFKVIIAGAVWLPICRVCVLLFSPMPVIGIPMHTTSLGGRDSPVLDRTDAFWYSGGYCGDQRRCKRRYSCSKDSCNL